MKIFMGKMCYEGTLLSSEEKQKNPPEARKLKLLIQIRNEAQILCGMVGNSGCC